MDGVKHISRRLYHVPRVDKNRSGPLQRRVVTTAATLMPGEVRDDVRLTILVHLFLHDDGLPNFAMFWLCCNASFLDGVAVGLFSVLLFKGQESDPGITNVLGEHVGE